jgi:hypothetical protein
MQPGLARLLLPPSSAFLDHQLRVAAPLPPVTPWRVRSTTGNRCPSVDHERVDPLAGPCRRWSPKDPDTGTPRARGSCCIHDEDEPGREPRHGRPPDAGTAAPHHGQQRLGSVPSESEMIAGEASRPPCCAQSVVPQDAARL